MLKIASYLFYLLSVVTAGFGAMYFFRADIMPYHYSFLQMDAVEINTFNPQLVKLMLAFMKIIGSSYIGIAAVIFLLALLGIRKRIKWTWWAMLATPTFPLVLTYIITLQVSSAIVEGPKPPSYLALGLIVVLVLGLLLSAKDLLKSK